MQYVHTKVQHFTRRQYSILMKSNTTIKLILDLYLEHDERALYNRN